MRKKIEKRLKQLKEEEEILKNKRKNQRMNASEAEAWWHERDDLSSKIEILEELLKDK